MVEVYEFWTLIVSLIVVKLSHLIYQWINPKCNGKLPPGSMGFPIIGKTFEFMMPHDAIQLPTFVKENVRRYGPLFRTSLFGAKVIISTDIGLNMEIAKTNHVPGMPRSLERLFGENNLFVQSKESHKHVRSVTTQFLGSQGLKLRMMQDIDLLTRTHMEVGARNGSLDVKETASKDKDLTAILSKTYIPFGAGSRLCLGADFAKLLMATFIHHLCRYRWSMKTETTVLRRFILMFPGGCDVQISEDTEVDNSAG